MNVIKQLYRDDCGATMVEYAIMLAFIAAVCIVAVATLGGTTMNNFSSFNAAVDGQ